MTCDPKTVVQSLVQTQPEPTAVVSILAVQQAQWITLSLRPPTNAARVRIPVSACKMVYGHHVGLVGTLVSCHSTSPH